ncbi:LARP4 [Candida metapsilosis]|uniref:LARP4 n=1 Tax=Candida metapsilosis TaxID=273372 RepID=A0A8H7ZIG7_9ASCO|nr:LARP4 [Candida metapsilosis]
MSNIRRLTPAPLPTTNAWDLNTLVLPKQDDDDKVAAKPPTSKRNVDSKQAMDTLLKLSPDALKIGADFPDEMVVESPQPKSATRITNKSSNLVDVGKRVKIRRPTLPRTREAKGGHGMFKYRITDEYSQPIIMSQPDLWTTTEPLFPLRPEMAYFTHSAEDHSLMSTDSATIPSPILIPSSNTSLFPQSPGMFSPQQPMVIFGMPMYSNLPLQHSSPQFAAPVAHESKRETLKGSIKKQLQYYFSTENLCKDTYLRSLFDKNDGKLRVKSLIEFNRLKVLTHDGKYAELVVEAARELAFLETLEGNEFIRLKTWKKWVMP